MDGMRTRQEKVDHLLATGIRNRWWCIGPSAMVQDAPVALTRLGEKLVAWRDETGKVNLVADRCPHRGAALSVGKVIEGRLTCRYHGVQVAGDGSVLDVPAFPGCELVGRELVKAYPTVEHFQAIWAWFGDEAHTEPPPIDLPEELTSPEWTGFLVSTTWHGNYQYVLDNFVDIMHPPYLHDDTYTLAYGDKSDVVQIDDTETGFIVRRKEDKESNVERMEFIACNNAHARVGVYIPPGGGPGGFLRIIATVVPIDENSSQFNAWRMRKLDGWQGAMFRFMFNNMYEPLTWEVIEQDREILETLPPWPAPENLYQHDLGVARIRRYYRREAEAQVDALERLAEGEAA